MYTIQRIDLKMTADPDATKEENYYNSESEGKEYKDFDEKYDAYIQATCEETFGKENCHEETYYKEKNNQEET